MIRFLVVCVIAFLIESVSLGQEKAGGPAKPHSPKEARQLFHLPPGLKIELVACEPNIESPVAMSFDPEGRLWVVEMLDYPNGPPPGKPGQGRIRVLEDRDGDGFFEKSTIFADNLLFANGLLHCKDGVIVTAAPHITWMRDTNGDGKADTTEVLYEGFAALNPQLRVSMPTLGLDGSVYVSNGLRGGMVVPAGTKAKPISLAGMDFRFNLLTGEHEAISGMGQYGNTFDDWGNRFVCDNRNHLRHIVLENRYLRNNPFAAAPSVVEDISVLQSGRGSGVKIYPLSKNWTTSNLHEGQFTAACGVFVYRGSLLPKEYQGAAFTCDPTGNLVHVERMTPKGATFEARPIFEEKEFLASTDDWCRPVFLSHGPDDALYMIDMYRAVIEHPEFMPPELKNRPDLTLGKDKGRIWRIVPEKGAKRGGPMTGLPVEELAKRLESTNAWERDVAHRLLLERNDKGPAAALKALVKETAEPRAKMKAAWLLEGLSALDEGLLLALLSDEHPRVREQGVLIAERRSASPALVKAVTALASADDARLRFQVALTLGTWKVETDPGVFASILTRGAEDRWTRLAVATAIPTRAGEVLAKLLDDREYQGLARRQKAILLSDLMAQIGARQDAAEVRGAMAALRGMKASDAESLHRTALLGLTTGLERRGGKLPSLLGKVYPRGTEEEVRGWLEQLLERTMQAAQAADRPVAERVDAIQLAGHGALASIRGPLLPLLEAAQPIEVRLAALRALGRHRDREIAAQWVRSWKTFSPAMQREAVDLLLRSPETTLALLDGVEKKQVRVAEIAPARARQLLKHPAAAIRERANALLSAGLPADRKEVMVKYQAALKLEGDPRKGKLLFAKHCMTCHRIAGEGTDVGPDISDTRTKTAAALLADILNPNQAIDANYIQYLVMTSSGQSLTGVLAAETASSITIKRAEGQVDVVLRSDIESIESTGLSLMPEGIEQSISVREMADLLSYLKNWRYLDGSVPLK